MRDCPNSKIKNLTFSDCINSFIMDKKASGLSKATINTYTIHLNEAFKIIGDINIEDFTKHKYNEIILGFQNKNIKDVTVATYCRSVRTFLYWCMNENYINRFKVKIPKYQKTIKEVYTDGELMKLLKKPNIKTCTFTEYKIWFLENILIATGLRISSLLNVKIQDIDLYDHSITINTTKNKTPMKTYYNDILAGIIKEYLKFRGGEPEDYLICTNDGKPMKVRSIQSAVKRYNHNRGVQKSSVHFVQTYIC